MTGIICVNKHEDITSFGVVAKIRGIMGQRKVGHTGTLDPMATGVLPIMLGGATRFLDYLPDSNKSYRATFMPGMTTDTLDITGTVTGRYPVTVQYGDVQDILQKFTGVIEQVPPMYSAKSVDGVRLYELARQGVEIQRQPCRVEIFSLELVDYSDNRYTIDVTCSKGTYIRSLIDDIGRELGCGAVMTSLCRTGAMGFDLSQCYTLDELQRRRDNGIGFEDCVISVDAMFECYKRISVSPAQAKRFFNGGELDVNRLKQRVDSNEMCRVYDPEGVFLGLGRREGDCLKVARILSKRD
ncbi:MAG: tRNA pseudouridine(55) synthase TruB [Eubacteriales bacterium]|nr:tRNA pseudouridine(55) synthase TruB [Eubacteriales bacterium]